MSDHLEDIRVNTAVARAKPIVSNIIRNAVSSRLWEYPTISGERPFAGATVVVAAAGPSLAKNIELLRPPRNFVLFALNSTLGILRKHGIRADVGLNVENLDTSEQLAPYVTQCDWLYLPLSSHPAAWEICPQRTAWYGHATFEEGVIHELLGTTPVQCSGNVASAAVALAMEMGAAKVVLVGQDLAYGPEGECYAAGAHYDSFRAKFVSDKRLEYESPQFEARHELHKRNGAKGFPRHQDVVVEKAWGGEGTVRTTWLWVQQRKWLEAQPQCIDSVELINATEGGSHIEGWKELALADAVRECGPYKYWVPNKYLPKDRCKATKGMIRDQALNLQRAARAVLRGNPEPTDAIPAWVEGYSLVRSAAIGEILEMQVAGMRAGDLIEYSWNAYLRAAKYVLELIDG